MNLRLEEHQKHLAQLAELITREEQCALVIAPDKEILLRDLADHKKKTGDKFMVLVVGEFNSGKTSMINALMGREILPTGDLPETGVITELVYGPELKLTLYPKKESGLTDPVVLPNPTMEEIRKHCSIDNDGMFNQQTTENVLYERTVVECDLPLLKEGIILVDSVGLNDPWGNDYITERYFPKADAIIYLLSGTAAYTVDDKNLLNDINDMGLRNLIIAVTKFGLVRQNHRRKPASELQNFMDVITRHALPHTDIGVEAIHFIDSIEAIEAKETGDQALLVKSGMDGLEKFCNKYLIEEKGKYKIISLVGAIESKERELGNLASVLKYNAGRSRQEFEAQIRAAQAQLEAARLKAEENTTRFETRIERDKPVYEESIRNHVHGLADKVNLDGYTLRNRLPRNFAKLIPGRQQKMAQAIAQECKAELEHRMKNENTTWISVELNKKIKASIESSVEDMSSEIEAFYDQLDDIDVALSAKQKTDSVKRNLTNILAGIAYTAFTGDFINGSIAAVHGTSALGRAVVADLVVGGGLLAAANAGVAIAIPVAGWALILGNIVAILLQDQKKAERKLIADTVLQLQKEYNQDVDGQEATAQNIINAYHQKVTDAVQNYKKMMDDQLHSKADEINASIQMLDKNADQQTELIEKNEKAMAELGRIVAQAQEIAKYYTN